MGVATDINLWRYIDPNGAYEITEPAPPWPKLSEPSNSPDLNASAEGSSAFYQATPNSTPTLDAQMEKAEVALRLEIWKRETHEYNRVRNAEIKLKKWIRASISADYILLIAHGSTLRKRIATLKTATAQTTTMDRKEARKSYQKLLQINASINRVAWHIRWKHARYKCERFNIPEINSLLGRNFLHATRLLCPDFATIHLQNINAQKLLDAENTRKWMLKKLGMLFLAEYSAYCFEKGGIQKLSGLPERICFSRPGQQKERLRQDYAGQVSTARRLVSCPLV